MKTIKSNIFNRIFISIIICSVFFLIKPVYQIFEYQVYDYKFQLREKLGKDPNISRQVINIVLDDDTYRTSTESYNWDRDKIAEVITALSKAGASTIGCDMIFVSSHKGDKDSLLVKAIASTGCVVLPYHMKRKFDDYYSNNEITELENILKIKDMPKAKYNNFPNFDNLGVFSFNNALKVTEGLGFANYSLDHDGIVRKIPLIAIYKDKYIPTFTLAIICADLDYDFKLIDVNKNSIILKKVKDDDIIIPIDKDGNFIVNYYGSYSEKNYRYSYSVEDILKPGNADQVKNSVVNNICIFSDISLKNNDFIHVPSVVRFPTSYLFSTVISNILNKDFFKNLDTGILLIILFIICFIILLADYLFDILKFTLLVITLMLIYTAVNYGLFIYFNLVLPYFCIIFPVSIISLIFFIMKIIKREKLRIETETNLRKFLSPPVFSFHFIEDENFKRQMISRWNEARKGYEIGAFRSTITLCGSIIEGLLSFSIRKEADEAMAIYIQKYSKSKSPEGPTPGVDKWMMNQLIEVAWKIGIISKNSKSLSYIINSYRNIIHPEVEVRENFKVNKNLTAAFISFLAIVYEDVEEWLKV